MHKPSAGINIPVFSLRTKKSLGVGEFLDLIPLIDWSVEAGFKLIQILPINTTYDSYPYSILSAFALNPIYINLLELAPELASEIHREMIEHNKPHLEYQKTIQTKQHFLKRIYDIRGEKDLASKEFASFIKKHGSNLKPYVAFLLKKEKDKYSDKLVNSLCLKKEAKFHFFVQFHLHRQLLLAVRYAKKHKIILKGDLPMGVDPKSVEAWRFPHYFRWHKSMGAPPDFYNANGQNWGFPPYDWGAIKKEKFSFLKTRLNWMEEYFDAVRLDHVLGYFRLWENPPGEKGGLKGIFYPSIGYKKEEIPNPELFLEEEGMYHPPINLKDLDGFKKSPNKEALLKLFDEYYLNRQDALWEKHGEEKLSFMKKNTTMQLFAEDIGVIPKCVGKVLKKLSIPNLYVQRMPKSFDLKYEDPKDFPKLCVCTPSNHDTETLREWWEDEDVTRYYHEILKHTGKPPPKLTEKLASEIITAHLQSKAWWAIFLLQDLFAMSDAIKFPDPHLIRINDPSDPHYKWRWRMHLYVEELLLAKSFTKKIRAMIKEAKR